MREFLLPYEDVRTLPDPDAALRGFLRSSYEAATELSGWEREGLKLKVIPALR